MESKRQRTLNHKSQDSTSLDKLSDSPHNRIVLELLCNIRHKKNLWDGYLGGKERGIDLDDERNDGDGNEHRHGKKSVIDGRLREDKSVDDWQINNE